MNRKVSISLSLAFAILVAIAVTSLAIAGDGSPAGDEVSTTCEGHPVDLALLDEGDEATGSAGDDYVIVSGGTTYRSGGGTDVICDATGKRVGLVVTDGKG